MSDVSQQSVLLYRRAETANREVLELLGRVELGQGSAVLHQRAAALSLELDQVLRELLELPVEPDPGPVTTD